MPTLLYTSCRPGASVSGASGFQPRAASRDLGDRDIRALATLASPPTPGEGPRLVWRRILDRWALAHVVEAARDPITGRTGNFFAHIVTGLPEYWDAADALARWGSPGWHIADDDGPARRDFPEIPPDPGPAPDLLALARAQMGAIAWLVDRILARTPGDSGLLLLGGPAEASGVLAAALALVPAENRRDLTFSTSEADPWSRDDVSAWNPLTEGEAEALLSARRADTCRLDGRALVQQDGYGSLAVSLLAEGRHAAIRLALRRWGERPRRETVLPATGLAVLLLLAEGDDVSAAEMAGRFAQDLAWVDPEWPGRCLTSPGDTQGLSGPEFRAAVTSWLSGPEGSRWGEQVLALGLLPEAEDPELARLLTERVPAAREACLTAWVAAYGDGWISAARLAESLEAIGWSGPATAALPSAVLTEVALELKRDRHPLHRIWQRLAPRPHLPWYRRRLWGLALSCLVAVAVTLVLGLRLVRGCHPDAQPPPGGTTVRPSLRVGPPPPSRTSALREVTRASTMHTGVAP